MFAQRTIILYTKSIHFSVQLKLAVFSVSCELNFVCRADKL